MWSANNQWSAAIYLPGCPRARLGPSIYDVHTKIRFLTPSSLSTCVHMNRAPSPLWTSTCGRHEIHIALLKRLVQWPSRPKADIRLGPYMIVIYLKDFWRYKLLISNLYYWLISPKNFHFLFRPKTKFWLKNANFFSRDKDRMMSVDSNFNFLCGRPHGAWLPFPPS